MHPTVHNTQPSTIHHHSQELTAKSPIKSPPKMSRTILVTGATGNQGGATVSALLAANAGFNILALTRDANSASSQKLKAKSSAITVIQGDLSDTEAVFKSAEAASSQPIWGVFSIQSPGFGKNGPEIEQQQGKDLVDSAIKHGVKHFVYSSVDRHGDRSLENPTNVPHFVSKHNIEHHLISKAKDSGMIWTILRPTAFMDNLNVKNMASVFATAWKTTLHRPLQLIATEDIGVFAAKAFVDVDQFKNSSLSLAGDELTFEELDKIFHEVKGVKPPQTWGLLVKAVFWMSTEMNNMFTWFEKEGYGANVADLKKIHPEMKDMRAWVKDTYSL
ncbi:NmrA-like family domain-containing oxidoreductase ptmS [Paramyrothecium foliicola]|nr:NmrA-like family domain-containing oxidoreductase ptmS [Paramyrothecium foliicola]